MDIGTGCILSAEIDATIVKGDAVCIPYIDMIGGRNDNFEF